MLIYDAYDTKNELAALVLKNCGFRKFFKVPNFFLQTFLWFTLKKSFFGVKKENIRRKIFHEIELCLRKK